MSKFYAPYFFTNVDLSPLQELARGQVVSAVRDVAHKLLDALRTVAEMLAGQLAKPQRGNNLEITITSEEIGNLTDIYQKIKKENKEKF